MSNTLTEAYAMSGGDGGARRKRIAENFRTDPTYERMLELQEKDPATYAALPPTAKISLGLYLQHKEAYLAEQQGESHV